MKRRREIQRPKPLLPEMSVPAAAARPPKRSSDADGGRPAQRLALIRALRKRIAECMLLQRRALEHRLHTLEKSVSSGPHWHSVAARLEQTIDRSIERAARRRRCAPVVTFAEHLPISQARQAIADALFKSQLVVVCGETASGKSTQLPKLCLSLGRGVHGLIGHTQPRRIAARSVSVRVAKELKVVLGQAVGYQVRFSDRLSDATYIKLMTDGILLAEIESDPRLERYDTLIIDEAHERTLNIDLLLGYLQQLLPKRPDLKVIIASATIDAQRFSDYFGGAPIVAVSGRNFPVEIRYRPLGAQSEGDYAMADAVSAAVQEIWDERPGAMQGDVLVFLPGERGIREAAAQLRKWLPSSVAVLPLYARLAAAKQDRIFAPHSERRIVLATNVAETSVTVPNIGYVIDSGLARMSRYSYRTKVQRLPIEKISQASAEQRKGRCGRNGPGVCVRLFSEEDFAARPEFTEPEVLRSDLGAVILRLKALGFGDDGAFVFLDSPDRRDLKAGFELLREVGALDESGALTAVGRRLARLPLHPRVGRILLSAAEQACLREALVVASFLSVDDPREHPLDAREAAAAAQAPFRHPHSDFLGSLALWAFYQEQRKSASIGALRALCRRHYLSYARMCEWLEVHRQLIELAQDMGLPLNAHPASYACLHRALLSGFLTRVGVRSEHKDYLGPRGMRFLISPASAIGRSSPKWVVAAELVETTRLYANQVARVRPEWIERDARHLVRRHYGEPRWDPSSLRVIADERVTFYGLPLVTNRRTNYGRIDPALAREIFIREGLVLGQYQPKAAFLLHNAALLEKLKTLEHKSRRLDVVQDDESIFRFYAERIPAGICSGEQFETWRHEVEKQAPKLLFLNPEDLLRPSARQVTQAAFPDVLAVDGQRYKLAYRFRPGDPRDGITATVPITGLMQSIPAHFEWLVPGRLAEKVYFLLRALPKDLRRALGPIGKASNIYAARLAVNAQRPPLKEALAREIKAHTGLVIPAEAWNEQRLPDHLRMNFCVVDLDGGVVDEGRDLRRLQQARASYARTQFGTVKPPNFQLTGIKQWDFGDLPEYVDWGQGLARCRGYPALADELTSVALKTMDSRQAAVQQHRAGLRRLFLLELGPALRPLKKRWRDLRDLCLSYATLAPPPFAGPDGGRRRRGSQGLCESLQDDALGLVVDAVFLHGEPMIRSEKHFRQRQEAGAPRLMAVAEEVNELLAEIFAVHAGIRKARARIPVTAAAKALADIDTQLQYLLYQGFLRDIDLARLRHLPRYLRALAVRLDRLQREPAKDALKLARMGATWQRCRELLQQHGDRGDEHPELGKLRWMVEELRVSLFAQELGTAYPVSANRIEEQWHRARTGLAARALR